MIRGTLSLPGHELMKTKLLGAVIFMTMTSFLAAQETSNRAPLLKPANLGDISGVCAAGDLYLVGHITLADLNVVKNGGVRRVITLMTSRRALALTPSPGRSYYILVSGGGQPRPQPGRVWLGIVASGTL